MLSLGAQLSQHEEEVLFIRDVLNRFKQRVLDGLSSDIASEIANILLELQLPSLEKMLTEWDDLGEQLFPLSLELRRACETDVMQESFVSLVLVPDTTYPGFFPRTSSTR